MFNIASKRKLNDLIEQVEQDKKDSKERIDDLRSQLCNNRVIYNPGAIRVIEPISLLELKVKIDKLIEYFNLEWEEIPPQRKLRKKKRPCPKKS